MVKTRSGGGQDDLTTASILKRQSDLIARVGFAFIHSLYPFFDPLTFPDAATSAQLRARPLAGQDSAGTD